MESRRRQAIRVVTEELQKSDARFIAKIQSLISEIEADSRYQNESAFVAQIRFEMEGWLTAYRRVLRVIEDGAK